jgi:hypothetical protein
MKSEVFDSPVFARKPRQIHSGARNQSSGVADDPEHGCAAIQSSVRLPGVILELAGEPSVRRRRCSGSSYERGAEYGVARREEIALRVQGIGGLRPCDTRRQAQEHQS